MSFKHQKAIRKKKALCGSSKGEKRTIPITFNEPVPRGLEGAGIVRRGTRRLRSDAPVSPRHGFETTGASGYPCSHTASQRL